MTGGGSVSPTIRRTIVGIGGGSVMPFGRAVMTGTIPIRRAIRDRRDTIFAGFLVLTNTVEGRYQIECLTLVTFLLPREKPRHFCAQPERSKECFYIFGHEFNTLTSINTVTYTWVAPHGRPTLEESNNLRAPEL